MEETTRQRVEKEKGKEERHSAGVGLVAGELCGVPGQQTPST